MTGIIKFKNNSVARGYLCQEIQSQNFRPFEIYLAVGAIYIALALGFEFLSTLIEDRLRETGPAWFRSAAVLERIDNYLRSGNTFAYLQVALQPAAEPEPSVPAGS